MIVDFAKKLNEKGDEISKQRASRLLVSAPVDIEFEIKVLQTAIGLVSGMLSSKFPTTIEQDKDTLQQPDLSWRKYVAVTHRLTQKEILAS